MASFTNLTRHVEIGANSYYLDLDGQGILLDAGMHPKVDGYAALPAFEKLDERPVDAIYISHAHHDHVGALPMLHHIEAPVFMSEPTYFLANILLRNSVNVMKRQKEEFGIEEYPLYHPKDILLSSKRWQACHFGQKWSFKGFPIQQNDTSYFKLHYAGHILGAAAIEIIHKGKSILYTGDINFSKQTVLDGARLPTHPIDTLIIEATRGAHPTPSGFSRKNEEQKLIEAIRRTFENSGAVMIPVFAMGKTQETITLLYQAQQAGELPITPIYIGGLSHAFNQIYDRTQDPLQRQKPMIPIEEMIAPQVLDGRKIDQLKLKKGHIYLVSSGMMNKNTISNKLAQQMLAREQDSILFVGYADPESPAGKLRATERGERVVLSEEYGDQPVFCGVESFDLTAHALREDILSYIQEVSPRQCILVHGDPAALDWMRARLNESHPKIKVIIAEPGQEIAL